MTGRVLRSLTHRPISNRQKAEIQLEGILNDPTLSLPVFARRASENLSDEEISIQDASKLLNTQPFIIERLFNALHFSSTNENAKSLNRVQIQKLTRVLNATMDVRALLFFMMLDENGDGYVSDVELAQFYEQYLKVLKTFDNERLEEVRQVLLQKFRLHEVCPRKVFLVHLRTRSSPSRNHKSISKNFIQSFPKIPP
jgi:hypothetical protein